MGRRKEAGSVPTTPPLPSRGPVKSKARLQDDSIMGTNNSSIVSKRSVERLYFPNEPHFFRYFVKKPLRRSPLINRGYWLRMQAIDQVVRQFLQQTSEKPKVVVNLGCGYDPLPWQCLSRYPAACVRTKFVDIDYRDLMLKKRAAVQATKELNSILTNLEVPDGDILLRSDQYIQLACDLRDLTGLERVLASAVDVENSKILFTAEVSITYMNVEASDDLIRWAGKLPEARFCLLEQLLPGGTDHPMSQTMMAHFNKLQTPLGAVHKYPTTTAQYGRFVGLGWSKVSVRNLWELWSAPDFASAEERKALDLIEPFDEFEEFALFGLHYFLLVADTSSSVPVKCNKLFGENKLTVGAKSESIESLVQAETFFTENPKSQGCRRFAAVMPVNGTGVLGLFGGMGLATRLNSYDEYALNESKSPTLMPCRDSSVPSARMCHTITDLGDTGVLLVGGRTSPDHGCADCWLYHRYLNTWERINDLPYPLYRHQAVSLDNGCALVGTGRINSQTLSEDYLLWNRQNGWVRCVPGSGDVPIPAYGAIFAICSPKLAGAESHSKEGLLAGGLSDDLSLQQDIWRWQLKYWAHAEPTITFSRWENIKNPSHVARFGASVITYEGCLYIAGGVKKNQMIHSVEEICALPLWEADPAPYSVVLKVPPGTPRPLLIGSSIACMNGALVVLGGSAVCFSFGTFWNRGCYTIFPPKPSQDDQGATLQFTERHLDKSDGAWAYVGTVEAQPPSESNRTTTNCTTPKDPARIPRIHLESRAKFDRILQRGVPVILEKLSLGSCTSQWTTEYLKDKVGFDRKIIVHEANTTHMDFVAKNFSYTTKRFGDFLDQINGGEKLYLRSLSSDKPSEYPSDITKDFSSISPDFCLPSELAVVKENVHSSPLRISGPVNMWLHYDVMANVYCQVHGSKRLLLFPPSDVQHLHFQPGASSSQIDAFAMLQDQALAHTSPQEAHVQAGDILFIPPLWLHTACPTSGVSIAVNVFFRNLTTGYAAGKDVYGNRDLQAYEKGRQDIAKIIKSFDNLPTDVRAFYLQRLASEFTHNAR